MPAREAIKRRCVRLIAKRPPTQAFIGNEHLHASGLAAGAQVARKLQEVGEAAGGCDVRPSARATHNQRLRVVPLCPNLRGAFQAGCCPTFWLREIWFARATRSRQAKSKHRLVTRGRCTGILGKLHTVCRLSARSPGCVLVAAGSQAR